ncbi:MAG: copper amine oxidase N-terminal domain-containing protein [Candidatus Eremiobacteraeota bacterium]|nr:copper amine oxidase N-terminal domain-containing protein [Candidatus Eremiobacteraeota bacterium]
MKALLRAGAFASGCVLLATPLFAAPAARSEERAEKPIRTIAIEVNGEPQPTAPIVVGGRLLFPLRDVFDALGIVISRNGSTIVARLPTGNVTIVVGSAAVSVNGARVILDGPIIDRDGATYAPLRLLATAFGAQVTYEQRAAKVDVVSAYVGRNSSAEQRRAGGGTDVQGVVSAIDSDSNPPSLTVVRSGGQRTISITSEAKVWTEDVTIHSQLHGTLADVRVGDAVHAILARDGRVVSVFDFYKSSSGTIAAVSPAAVVLDTGHVIAPGSTTEISLNSVPAKIGDLKVGDFLTVKSNPESGELRQLVASRSLAAVTAAVAQASAVPTATASASNVQIQNVFLSATHPLRAGEDFQVTLHGTPGGRAAFDIGDLLTKLEMKETSPGIYVGHFTIPDRFNVTQVPVYGTLSVGADAARRTEAQETLSAATTPPRIEEVAPPGGQTVNNSRPSIFATFAAPTEIAINLGSVSLVVNGHDVTSSATRTSGFITYSPGVDLPEGPATVLVRVSDAAGNTSTRTWNFTIKTR